ncbi:MAG TPA: type II secretion system F family protein [Chlamydiales bacterium]|jgi:general secretion pathway protein F/type IV pilus assembly protein PilC|nr:type II secretion system F family protein [Chlamydiales bacterium]
MALYRFEALDVHGKKTRGTLDAENEIDAKQKLRKQSIYITRIDVLLHKNSQPLLKKNEILNFTRELSRLLKAGLPLYECLSAMEEKYRGQKAQRILLGLCEQVRSGQAFSSALAGHPKTFDLLFIAMVSNAEKTGRLGPALEELSALLAKQQQVRKQLVGAFLYPALLFGFCLFVLSALLFYVIPSLQELFEGRSLHPFTKIVFAVSTFACNSKMMLLSSLVGIGIAVSSFWVMPKWKTRVYCWILRLPILNRVFSKVALIRFFRATSTLLNGGVPIVAAFAEARRAVGHPILEQIIERAEDAITQGEEIHAPFVGHPLIPPLVPRMLGIAEKGGNLDGMMRQIAEIYEEDLEKALAHFSTVAQPILLMFLGVIVGFVLLSVLLPLTDVSSFATDS